MIYKRRKRYSYKEYYSDDRLYKYFYPIISDLKNLFFKLDESHLNKLLNNYKEKYGDKAYRYALATYPKWKNGYRKMSDQTLLRLVETLPYFIEYNERIKLLEKLFNYFSEKIPKKQIIVPATFETYNSVLNDIKEKLINKYSVYYKPTDFQQEILDLASWLSLDDMITVKKILSQYYFSKYTMHSNAALNDIERFRFLCNNLKFNKNIYDPQILQLSLPNLDIFIQIKPNKKSILYHIKNIFS